MEERRENINQKVSDEDFTTESSINNTTLLNTEPFTEITTFMNVPTSTAINSSEATTILIPVTEILNDNKSVTKIPISILTTANNNISIIKPPISTIKDIIDSTNTKTMPTSTSTITNVITSIYEAATERQKVRVKNIQNFLLEHKKTEPITQPIIRTTTPLATISSTTIKNIISVEKPIQKSFLKGRFGSQVPPTLRKSTLPPEISATTEKLIETTDDKIVDTITEKKFRLNKYVSRFSRPIHNNTENASTANNKVTKTTESILESSTRQFNRFRSTKSQDTNINASLSRRSFSRFRSTTSETPSTSSIPEVQKSRFFRSRKPILSTSTSTSTTTTEVTTNKEIMNSEENSGTVHYETTFIPTTINFPTINYEKTSSNNEELKMTTINDFETTKFMKNELSTIQPTTIRMSRTRGSIRAINAFEDNINEKLQSSSRGRENSRFLKNEQKILYIRVLPSPEGRTQNEFTSPLKNTTRNRGRIRAFDSLELNTLNDGFTNEDRPNELFRGSETKFRVAHSINESTEEV